MANHPLSSSKGSGAFHLATRELRHSGTKLKAVLFILIIGFLGPLFSSALRSSVADYLDLRTKQILAADLVVNSLRPLKPAEDERLREVLQAVRLSREIEFVTMGKGAENATLVEVKGVDANFPIFGDFEFKVGDETRRERDASKLQAEKIAWVFPEVLAQLNLKAGDSIGIGKVQFRITEILHNAPGMTRAGGVAPRIYIGRNFIAETGLTQFGAQVAHREYVQLPRGLTAETASARVKQALEDPQIFLRTPDDSIRSFDRFFRFFNLYLGAVTMVVFVLSWVSAFYILQIFLQDRLKNAAVFLINGAGRMRVGSLYVLQVFVLILLAFVIASLIVIGLVLAAPALVGHLVPEGFVLRIGWRDEATIFVVALASTIAFSAPFLVRLYALKLQTLLGESALGVEKLGRRTMFFTYGPMVIVFLGLSIWMMDSFVGALRIAGGMTLAAGIGLLIGRLFFRLLFTSVRRTPGRLRLVATSLARSRFGVNLCFLALVLVGLSLNLVPHLLESVITEVRPLQGKEVPALFLFNIPETQVESLQKFAAEQQVELRYLSPLILGRLQKVNGKPSENEFFQRFEVRLSTRAHRLPSETLLQGRDFSGTYDPNGGATPEISVEGNYAERNGFKVGDVLEFDIQGIPIEGKVVSLRHVKWTTFNPNFFIQFQPGVVDEAPKTFVANVNFEGGEEKKVKVQFELIRNFPDITIIDIGRTISRVLEVAQSVIGPIKAAAWIAVTMSFIILLGVIAHNLRLRNPEIDIEKLLGANSELIRSLIVGEYAITAFFAWLVGAGSALAIAWAVVNQALDIPLQISWPALWISFIATLGATIIIAFISSTQVLRLRGASRKL